MLKNNSLSPSPASGALDFLYIVKAVAFSYALSLAALSVAAFIASARCFSDKGIFLSAKLVCALGVLFCGFLSGRHSERRGILSGALSGIFYTLILWIVGGISAQRITLGTDCATALTIGIVCGAVGGIFGINTAYRRRR